MDKKTNLINTLKDYAEYLESYSCNSDVRFKVIGIFLYGSQNYRMDTENSDVDAYAVVIPCRMAFAFLPTPINYTAKVKGAQVKVKDVRVFVQELLKGNYSTLELLVTPYRYIPDETNFQDLFETKVGDRLKNWEDRTLADLVLAWNLSRTIASTLGSVQEMKRTVEKTDDLRVKVKNLARICHCHRLANVLMLRTYPHMETYGYRMTEEFTYAISGAYDYEQDIVDDTMKDLIAIKQLDPDIAENTLQALEEKMQENDQNVRNTYEHWKHTVYLNSYTNIGERQELTRELLSYWVQNVFRSGLGRC